MLVLNSILHVKCLNQFHFLVDPWSQANKIVDSHKADNYGLCDVTTRSDYCYKQSIWLEYEFLTYSGVLNRLESTDCLNACQMNSNCLGFTLEGNSSCVLAYSFTLKSSSNDSNKTFIAKCCSLSSSEITFNISIDKDSNDECYLMNSKDKTKCSHFIWKVNDPSEYSPNNTVPLFTFNEINNIDSCMSYCLNRSLCIAFTVDKFGNCHLRQSFIGLGNEQMKLMMAWFNVACCPSKSEFD